MTNKAQLSPQVILILVLVLGIPAFYFIDPFQWRYSWETLDSDLPQDATAKDITPTIDEYKQIDIDNLVAKATSAIVGASVAYTTSDVESAYSSAQVTKKFMNCYQEAGAIDSKGFYKLADPIYGGAVVVADENQIKNPKLLHSCIAEVAAPLFIAAEKKEYNACADKIIIKTPYNNFYVLIAGTDTTVCTAIRTGIEHKV